MAEKHILVVDDDQGVRDMLQRLLLKTGYAVETAANGLEAMHQIREKAPDLMVLDLMMPGMNGLEVLELLGADAGWKKIPVIVLTAAAGHSAQSLGVRAMIPKPFNIMDVQKTVREVLGT